MYHPLCPCGDHMPLLYSLSCTSVLVSSGDMGLRLKPNSSFSCAQANSFGFNIDGRRRLSVISACSRRRSQFYIGKSGSVAQSPAMK